MFLPAWGVWNWRWIARTRQEAPKILSGLILFGIFMRLTSIKSFQAWSLPYHTQDYYSRHYAWKQNLYDRQMLKILAKRRKEIMNEEAHVYESENMPTNVAVKKVHYQLD